MNDVTGIYSTLAGKTSDSQTYLYSSDFLLVVYFIDSIVELDSEISSELKIFVRSHHLWEQFPKLAVGYLTRNDTSE